MFYTGIGSTSKENLETGGRTGKGASLPPGTDEGGDPGLYPRPRNKNMVKGRTPPLNRGSVLPGRYSHRTPPPVNSRPPSRTRLTGTVTGICQSETPQRILLEGPETVPVPRWRGLRTGVTTWTRGRGSRLNTEDPTSSPPVSFHPSGHPYPVCPPSSDASSTSRLTRGRTRSGMVSTSWQTASRPSRGTRCPR